MTKTMRILVIADSKLPVPPEGYGGAERIVALLCEGFAARGHRVTLMAAPGSRNYGRLVTYPWAGRQARIQRAWARGVFTSRALVEAARGQDVIVSIARTDWMTPLLRLGLPTVYNFQNPIGADQVSMLRRHARGPLRLISISDAQRAGFSGDDWRTIHNAVDVTRLPFSAQGRDGYLAFLGRLTANKGVDTAIRAARRAGLPLRIAGNVSDEEGGRAFFEREVAPHLGDGVEWIGEIGDLEKPAFLGGARALLVPIRWDEPFGIVVPEALACGTPVIAAPRGSMPELIRDGVNGFFAADEDATVAAIGRLDAIDRAVCRADAEGRFAAEGMVERYLDVVGDVARSSQIGSKYR